VDLFKDNYESRLSLKEEIKIYILVA